MAAEMWKAGSEVYDLMKECIRRYHSELAMIEDKIDIVFKDKASTPGGRVIAGKTKRAPALLKTLGKIESIFIFELGADTWQAFSSEEKVALIDHHLCSLMVVTNAQTGDFSYRIAPPDFIGYKGEIERHGVWRYLNVEDDEDEEDVISKLFGKEKS